MKVSIIGATGYGGLELIRLLHQHSSVDIATLHSFSAQAETLATFYPHLKDLEVSPLEKINPTEIIEKVTRFLSRRLLESRKILHCHM